MNILVVFLLYFISNYCYANLGFSNSDINLTANSLEYLEDENKIIAKGSVEIIQDTQKLYADEVIYYSNEDKLFAIGHVKFYEKNNYYTEAEKIELFSQFKQGIIESFKLVFPDKSVLIANKAIRKSENLSIIENGKYTPCKFVCEKIKPLWRIRAKNVKINKKDQKVTYKHAFFEIKNIPVLYTPYLSHPTPNADRKSGFLSPTIIENTYLGRTIKIPYYHVINDNQDITITSQPTSMRGLVMHAEHRVLLEDGHSKTNLSITKRVIKFSDNEQNKKLNNIRGHISSNGQYSIPYDSYILYNINLASDKTYLKNYKPLSKNSNDANTLTSNITVNRFVDRNTLIAKILYFQNLSPNNYALNRTPVALPYIQTKDNLYEFDNGSNIFYESNFLSLHDEKLTGFNRASLNLGWRNTYYTDHGSVFNLQTNVRQDFYDYFHSTTTVNNEYFTSRTIPRATLDWSYPLVNYYNNYNIILEPTTNLIFTPKKNYNKSIYNSDSQYIDLNDTNLLSNNRFSGMDAVENDYRANYAIKGSIYNNLSTVKFMIGQSFSNFNAKNPYNYVVNGHSYSNYIGRIGLDYLTDITLNYRFILNKKNKTILKHEIEFRQKYNYIEYFINYIEDKDNVRKTDGIMNMRELSAKIEFSKNQDWKFALYGRKNLTSTQNNPQLTFKGSRLISAGISASKETECVKSQLTAERDYTYMVGKKPSNTYMFRVWLKNLM